MVFKVHYFIKRIKSLESKSTNEAELDYASNYDKSLPMSNVNTFQSELFCTEGITPLYITSRSLKRFIDVNN
jgi:hypothetical protein